MSLHDDRSGQARQLAVNEPKRLLQANLRRSERFDLVAEPATTVDMCGPVLGRSEHPRCCV